MTSSLNLYPPCEESAPLLLLSWPLEVLVSGKRARASHGAGRADPITTRVCGLGARTRNQHFPTIRMWCGGDQVSPVTFYGASLHGKDTLRHEDKTGVSS